MLILIGAGIGAFTTAAGWLIGDILQRRRTHREVTLREIDRRIEELLGPLLGMVRLSRHVYEVATTVLPSRKDEDGRSRVDAPRFSPAHLEGWRFLCESYFLPINARVRDLVTTKMHLMPANAPHLTFEEFFRYSAHFECTYRLWKERGLDSSPISGPRYPRELEEKVVTLLDGLRTDRMRCLHGARMGS